MWWIYYDPRVMGERILGLVASMALGVTVLASCGDETDGESARNDATPQADGAPDAEANADAVGKAEVQADAMAGFAEWPVSQRILAENAKPGSPGWRIEDGEARPRGIEGFTDRISGQQGDTVRLFASTAADSFEVVAYRLGHYDGAGAREVWSSRSLPGIVQPDCPLDPATRMVECSNWSPSLGIEIDEDWPPGQYVLKLIPSEGSATLVPFVLLDYQSHSDVLVISSVTTLLAYNDWGGYSFYKGEPHAITGSFDRPLDIGWAQSGIIGDTYNVGQMLESMGLDVSYTTNVDQHLQPELLKNHRVIVSGAHDEYYSLEMRQGLEAARDSGVNIVFLGANAVFRRIRFEDSPLGPARRVVNHRSAATDPLTGIDDARVTTSWRDPPAARPESSLTGTYYECNGADLVADMVIADAGAWMFEGTNVTTGQHWPGAVRQEYDRVNTEVPTPPSIQVLARSPLECGRGPSYADMAYYTADSGAGVFNSGTLQFEPRLGPLCRAADLTPEKWECQLRQMMANIFSEFAKGPAALEHPSRPNLHELSHFVSVHPAGPG